MKPPSEHQRLGKPPLVETVFELRYISKFTTDAIRTQLLSKFPNFSNEELLHSQQLIFKIESGSIEKVSPSEEPLDLVLFRYRNPEKNEFLQLGKGILSIHSLAYTGFADFFSTVQSILASLHEMNLVSEYRGLLLRYINHFSLDLTPQRVFAWLTPIPTKWDTALPIQNLQQTVFRVEEDLQIVTVAYPQQDQQAKMVMVFDIQHRIDFDLLVEPDLDKIISWLEEAHVKVYETFEGALKPDFFEELK